jgi:predicted dehydrogenase/threonine dehydrogenase-like Zn-dependent dehydrogenase
VARREDSRADDPCCCAGSVALKQVLIRRGEVTVDEVPAPSVEPGTVLVRVDHSCISAGTELSGIQASATPLWRRALRQPEKVAKVVDIARSQGVGVARDLVNGKLSSAEAMGYSLAGVVVEVGPGVEHFVEGDRVACAGAQSAHHAEFARVPSNLTVPIPEGLSFAEASTVTLGAIALQGVRRASPTLGETFVVIGLGILGQLTAQILKANGCRVIGMDVDPARSRLATELGIDATVDPVLDDDVSRVARLTDGIGADGVIVTAASRSDAILSSAFRMCRRKGRVVLVGDVGLDIDRADIYQKELDFLVSTSYGPGRYDRRYEEEGLDYPVGYVRWTENRNMAEYLRLVAEGSIQLRPLIGAVYPIEDAPGAYAALQGPDRPLISLLAYPGNQESTSPSRRVANPGKRPGRTGSIRVGVIGAGEFAKGMHLPNLRALSAQFELRAVASRTGHNAKTTADQFNAAYSTTDFDEILADPDVDLVLIATRHDRHAEMALAALERGKHVLVEKPLALNNAELEAITTFFEGRDDAPILQTGFNRRFSSYAARIADIVRTRSNPMVMTYRMNAGYLPKDHWTQGPEGGGRNLGEACHIYDLFTFLTGSRVAGVQATAFRPTTDYYLATDNFVATISFEDGSIGTLTYTALGSGSHPKEQLEVFVDGKVVALDDYRRLTIAGSKAAGLNTTTPSKGQREELEALGSAIKSGGEWPIPLWQQVQATEIAFEVDRALRSAVP